MRKWRGILFLTLLISIRGAQVSDQGLSLLGTCIKELRTLTNLWLNFRYFYQNYFFEFTKPFCEVSVAFGEFFVITFIIFISVVLRSRKGAKFFFNWIILNSQMQVSDQGLSTLGASIKELRRLTNLSLTFRYFI